MKQIYLNRLEQSRKLIDLDGIIKVKNPKLYKKLPGFVVRWFAKLICQDKMNRLLTVYGDKYGADFIDSVFDDLNVEIKCHGLSNVEPGKRYVFVANHPLGGLDGMAVISTVIRHFGKSKGIVNELLLNIENLKDVFCGVNVYGHNNPKIFESIEALYNSTDNICIFPAGICSRKVDGKVQDLAWKKNFIEKAVKYNIPIVPIFVEALNSKFFYNTALLRKKLGIKFNYELVLLPSEVFKYHDKPLGLHFGKPIMPEQLREMQSADARVQFVRQAAYAMSEGK